MSPMTIVVVRDVPAVTSWAADSAAGGFASIVAGVEDVVADAALAAVAAPEAGEVVDAEDGAAGVAVDCENAAVEARARVRTRAEIAGRLFMSRETIGRARTRQARGVPG
jgi:hypothetical protein